MDAAKNAFSVTSSDIVSKRDYSLGEHGNSTICNLDVNVKARNTLRYFKDDFLSVSSENSVSQ